jgi:16S rRNA (uracil1498-N3)-methyltransferase
MEIRYIYFPDVLSSEIIPERELHHLKVLRVKDGHKLRILDGKGSVYEGILDKNKIKDLQLLEKRKPFPEIILIQALIKPNKAEILLQKSCEIGVSKIIFVKMERSVIPIDSFIKRKERFKNILIDAIKQSHNLFLPELLFFDSLKDLMRILKGYRICFYEKCNTPYNFLNMDFSSNINFLIGPEGGITPEEKTILENNDFILSSLSSNILRSETAAIYALSVFNYISRLSINDSSFS